MQPIYYVKRVDNSKLVPLDNPGEPRQYLRSTVVGALVLGAVLFSAMGRFQSLEYGYRIERLEKDKKIALETNRKLQLEEASLGDPLRIDWIARNELGMKTLAPDQIYRSVPEPLNAQASASSSVSANTLAANARPEQAPVLTARIQSMPGLR